MIFLGLDTSNYTTSVAAVGGETINIRRVLEVEKGKRGLRQSEALFCHIKALPELFSQLCEETDIKNAAAVGISTRPRKVEGSYMPVFLAGKGYGEVISNALGIPAFEFSHQDGHIMAGIHSANADFLTEKPFISVHLSGGTCEILLSEFNGRDFDNKIIGGSKDISAGQLTDRIGVAMGFEFPSGKALDELSQKSQNPVKLPVSVSGSYINFSGIETKALSLINKEDNSDLASGLFIAVSEALSRAIETSIEEYKTEKVLIVGGVAANSIIKNQLKNKFGADIYFASGELSTDNAVGTALLAQNYFFHTGGDK